ncbi:MAG: VCBS repeat-containing protein [Planctomycetes bacterium]|nr:VCBS repeat-containing protein [Planctomycetota bacterium]
MLRNLISGLGLLLASAGAVAAQQEVAVEVLALGDGLEAIVADPAGLLLQGDGQISLIAPGPEVRVLAEARLSPEAFTWTLSGGGAAPVIEMETADGELAVAMAAPGTRPASARARSGPSLFRGRPSAAAQHEVRIRDHAGHRYRVSPVLDGLRVRIDDADESLHLPAACASEQSLGWGLGYEMSARLVVPWFAFAETDGRDGLEILYRDGPLFRVQALGAGGAVGANRAWGRAPAAESTEVVRFDQRVPPLLRDFDGDGLDDLVHLDPGGGYVFVYRGRGRGLAETEAREPDQIFNVGGHALWRSLADVDGDGRLDLIVLSMSKMNVVAQVNVMRAGSLPVRLFCRRQKENGDFEASTLWNASLELPFELAITRNLRRVRFRSPLLVIGQVEGRARLLATRRGRCALLEQDGNDWREIVPVPELLLEDGHWSDPFDAPRGDFDGDGRTEVLLLGREVEGTRDRLLRVELP